jgi:hypothetical protein
MNWILQRLVTSPRTTIIGFASLIALAIGVVKNPAGLNDPQVLAGIAAGVGLLVAGDDSKLPPPQLPQLPQTPAPAPFVIKQGRRIGCSCDPAKGERCFQCGPVAS